MAIDELQELDDALPEIVAWVCDHPNLNDAAHLRIVDRTDRSAPTDLWRYEFDQEEVYGASTDEDAEDPFDDEEEEEVAGPPRLETTVDEHAFGQWLEKGLKAELLGTPFLRLNIRMLVSGGRSQVRDGSSTWTIRGIELPLTERKRQRSAPMEEAELKTRVNIVVLKGAEELQELHSREQKRHERHQDTLLEGYAELARQRGEFMGEVKKVLGEISAETRSTYGHLHEVFKANSDVFATRMVEANRQIAELTTKLIESQANQHQTATEAAERQNRRAYIEAMMGRLENISGQVIGAVFGGIPGELQGLMELAQKSPALKDLLQNEEIRRMLARATPAEIQSFAELFQDAAKAFNQAKDEEAHGPKPEPEAKPEAEQPSEADEPPPPPV